MGSLEIEKILEKSVSYSVFAIVVKIGMIF